MATDSGSGYHCLSAENRIVFDSGKSIGYYSRKATGTKRFSDEVATHACVPLFFGSLLSAVFFGPPLGPRKQQIACLPAFWPFCRAIPPGHCLIVGGEWSLQTNQDQVQSQP